MSRPALTPRSSLIRPDGTVLPNWSSRPTSPVAAAAAMPQAQPGRNVWQFMRDNWLPNRIFKS